MSRRALCSLYLEHCVETFAKGVKIGARLGEAFATGLALLELAPEDLGAEQGEDAQEKEEKDQQGHWTGAGNNFFFVFFCQHYIPLEKETHRYFKFQEK